MKKSAIRISIFLIILILFLGYCNSVFKFKYSDGMSIMSHFYELDPNTVDVLVLGTSHAHVNFSTAVLWREYGMSSYDLGGSAQPMWNTYYYLKEALKTQNPELIILDAYAVTFDYEYSEDSRVVKNTYGLKWSLDRIDAIKTSVRKHRVKDFILDYSQYHTRYNLLDRGDFIDDYGSQKQEYNWFGSDWKGQYLFNVSTQLDVADIPCADYATPLPEKSEEYYRKIIELAQEKNIPILVVVAPYQYSLSEMDESIFLTAAEIAEEYGVKFIDYNLLLDEIGFDYNTDYHDGVHMTARGATKFTEYVSKYIKSNYSVSDHRGDPKYSSWDRWTCYSDQFEYGEKLKETYDIDALKDLLTNDNFYVFISVDGNSNSSSEGVREFVNSQGIYDEDSNGIWMVQGGIAKFGSGASDYEKYIRTDRRDICIRHIMDPIENVLIIDNVSYPKKVENGVNVTVYDTFTNVIVDTFGINYDDIPYIVR